MREPDAQRQIAQRTTIRLYRGSTERKACANCGQTKNLAGDLPSLKGLAADAHFRPVDNAAVCIDSLSHSTPSTPWEWVGWFEWITEFSNARNKVVNGAEDPHKTFVDMIDNLNRAIAQYTA